MKITGITVGTTLPKPNFDQTDPSKGDYIKNRPFYTEGGGTVLIDGDFESLSVMSNNLIQTGVNVNFIEGESYTLYINGENKGTVVCANSDIGVNFGSGYSSYQVLPNGNIAHFDGDGTFNIKFIQGTDEIVHQIDHKYIPNADWNASEGEAGYVKNRTHYEEIVKTDISGMEITLTKDWSRDEVEHGMNLPFELGQVWMVTNTSQAGQEFPVQEADDGTLYIGSYPNTNPFYVTTNTLKGNLSWIYATSPERGIFTCVSGYVTSTNIKKLDPKYLPETATDEEILQCLSNSINLSPITEDGKFLVEGDSYLVI